MRVVALPYGTLVLSLIGGLATAQPALVEMSPLSDLVRDAETAAALTVLLVRTNYGETVLSGQEPLNARDGGTYWIVEGSPTPDRPSEGQGRLIVKINKTDACVLSLLFEYEGPPPSGAPR